MTDSNELEKARSIALQATRDRGEILSDIFFLDSGSTSNAFLLTTECGDYVLRIANPRGGKSATYEADFAMRKAMSEAGLPVARPIATNQTVGFSTTAIWVLDEYIKGEHTGRGDVPPAVSRQVGELLRFLHDLTASRFGRLETVSNEFVGATDNPIEGMLMRFEQPWPFTHIRLEEHPAVQAIPALRVKLAALRDPLRTFVLESDPVVTHSDLHEGQLLINGDKLTGLLDFNDACLARREWDFGSYLYFHGEDCLSALLDGYTESSREKQYCWEQAKYAAILTALHHGNRGVVLDRPHRIAASAQFLLRQLS